LKKRPNKNPTNPDAMDFLKNLCAVFSRYPISDETTSNYAKRLCRWNLTAQQWDDALETIIDSQPESARGLPELHEIYPALRRAKENGFTENALGWAYFRLADTSYAIRIRSAGGAVVIHDLVGHDARGDEIHLQPHYGEPLFDHIPADAVDFLMKWDNPARPDADNLLTLADIQQIKAQMGKAVGLTAA